MLGAGLLLALGAMAVTIGPRADFAAVAGTWRVLAKFAITLALAAAGLPVARQLLRPGAPAPSLRSAALPLALACAAVAAEMVLVPPSGWWPRLIGTNALWCLVLVPLLSLAPLALVLGTMSYGAPTRPARAGAAAGLLAGALGAAAYAFHCVDDSPLFVALWYGLGIGIVTLLGAVAGSRLLRW